MASSSKSHLLWIWTVAEYKTGLVVGRLREFVGFKLAEMGQFSLTKQYLSWLQSMIFMDRCWQLTPLFCLLLKTKEHFPSCNKKSRQEMDARMQIALPILGTVAADAAASAGSFSELREVSLNIVVISFLFNQSSIKYNIFLFFLTFCLFESVRNRLEIWMSMKMEGSSHL